MSSENTSNIIDRLCLLVGVGLALATLAGFLGRLFWVFDLFSHFRVQIFQAALVLIGIAVWRKQNRQLVLWILLAGLNYAFVLPLYFGKPPVAAEQPARAMLMNLNALNGNADQVLNAIRTADPDLLLLEEVTPTWAGKLSVLNIDYPYRVSKVRNDPFGILLLSKLPLSRTNVVFVGDAQVPTIVAAVHLPQGEIFVVGTHPVPPVSAEFSNLRNRQLAALPQWVREQKKPVLLIGDLNTSPWSSHFTRLLKDSGLQNSMKGFGFQPSWPSGNRLLRIPLDHMLHSPEILIHNRVVGSDVGSDHLPLLIDFSVR
ncbi:MAG: endonuclease/exonuclease/phosphatase family protein [Verrucomicrobia bacterium]|nr:endonuclease/exonuclease/phosphatase family protein [Verrucomicrobiota bacterium]